MIGLKLINNDFEYGINMLIKVFYPLEQVQMNIEGDITIEAVIQDNTYSCYIYKSSQKVASFQRVANRHLDKRESMKLLKLIVYRGLSSFTGKVMPWGVLTGIRPTKIVFELLNKGLEVQEIRSLLKEDYCIEDNKIDLMLQVATAEQAILEQNQEGEYSLYIGIPFCPTKCLYCSFTSYSLEKYSEEREFYVDALIKEIHGVKNMLGDKPIRSLYIGGGTPTSLTDLQLDRVLKEITHTFDVDKISEFTVEAGRPDTITKQKLEIIKKYNVDRISINPQTMNDKTLQLIGRRHQVEDIIECFHMARTIGFDNINMDIILGLPDETVDDVQHTLEEIKKLKPDNLTVHTMAIKRASKLKQLPLEDIMAKAKEVEQMLKMAEEAARDLEMEPYYMYRQKNMVGNFENVGYALKGKESVYNIEIMEEKETIVALGAGAITKVVYPLENRIERIENVKNFQEYISRVDEMIERKRKLLPLL